MHFTFLQGFHNKKGHHMLSFILDPRFFNVSSHIIEGHENVSSLIHSCYYFY